MYYTQTYLKKRGIEIYDSENNRILSSNIDVDYPQQNPGINTSQQILTEKQYKNYPINYERLRSFNMKIVEEQYREKLGGSIKTSYNIVYNDNRKRDFGKIPDKLKVEFSNSDWTVRLAGPVNLIESNKWLKVDRTGKSRNKKYHAPDESLFYMKKQFKKSNDDFRKIKEPILGISVDGEVVCLPNDMDEPRIGGAGEPGQGKTWFLHGLKDELVDKGNVLVIELNDVKNETGEYVLAWETESIFIDELKVVNKISKPMQMVYLHPTNNRLDDIDMIYPNKLGFRIMIPFKRLMLNPSSFASIKKYKLDKSWEYLEQLIYDFNGKEKEDGLLSCKSLEEMWEFIDDHTKSKKNPNPDACIPPNCGLPIKRFLKSLWTPQILDLFHKKSAKWKIKIDGKIMVHFPWVVCLMAGLSTSIVTKNIIEEEYYPILLSFFMKDIFYEKRSNPFLKNKSIMIYVDEAPDLTQNKKSYEVLDKIMAKGRSDGIGVGLTTQYYDEFSPSLISKMSHFVVFKSNQDNSRLKKDWFGIYPKMVDEIPKLKKKECIMCGDLTLYRGDKKYSNNGRPIRMYLLPPTSRHHPPPSKNGQTNN